MDKGKSTKSILNRKRKKIKPDVDYYKLPILKEVYGMYLKPIFFSRKLPMIAKSVYAFSPAKSIVSQKANSENVSQENSLITARKFSIQPSLISLQDNSQRKQYSKSTTKLKPGRKSNHFYMKLLEKLRSSRETPNWVKREAVQVPEVKKPSPKKEISFDITGWDY